MWTLKLSWNTLNLNDSRAVRFAVYVCGIWSISSEMKATFRLAFSLEVEITRMLWNQMKSQSKICKHASQAMPVYHMFLDQTRCWMRVIITCEAQAATTMYTPAGDICVLLQHGLFDTILGWFQFPNCAIASILSHYDSCCKYLMHDSRRMGCRQHQFGLAFDYASPAAIPIQETRG